MTVNLTLSTFARLDAQKDEKVWPQNGLKFGKLRYNQLSKIMAFSPS